MISPEVAHKIILKNSRFKRIESVPLMEALGCILAEKIRVPIPLPHWDNSAMDGFALNSQDTLKAHQSKSPVFLKIIGTLKAGDPATKKLKTKEAVRIMTGAPIPVGADTVLAKEMALVENEFLKISEPIEKGRHIRKKGEEIQKGVQLDLCKIPIHSGTIAFLSQVGRTKVAVYAKPKVAILTTGSELVMPGKKLAFGKIYDSNSPMLLAALISLGIRPHILKALPDKSDVLRQALVQALRKSDLILLTGGVSVGDYDFSKTVLGEIGVKTLFWKVSQKPGKPIYFGKIGSKLIFGLPGNPASAHMCFYEYVLPAIRNLMGFHNPFLERQKVLVKQNIKCDSAKTLFLKSKLEENNRISVLPYQGSHMISSLHETNGFLVVPPGNKNLKKGRQLAVDKLP